MAKTIRLMIDAGSPKLAAIIAAVITADPQAVVALAGAESVVNTSEPGDNVAEATTPKVRRTLDGGAKMVAYVPAKGMTTAKIAGMKLTPQWRTIAAMVLKKSPVTHAVLTEKSGMNFKSVQSALYQLRHTTPPVIKSVPRPVAK